MIARSPAHPSRAAATPVASDPAPSQHAVEFVRFCYRRRRVGWPDLYDEMCAVAGRNLFRGWGADELSEEGIGLSLFEMPALAALVRRIVAEEQHRFGPLAVVDVEPTDANGDADEPTAVSGLPVVVSAGA